MTPRQTIRQLIMDVAARFDSAGLVFGHGTDNAQDEAAALVLHALGLPFDVPEARLDKALTAAEADSVNALIARRISTRKPAAYLTGEAWFAGLPFHVDERVLVPRSPIAELIEEGFSPWVDPALDGNILDLCTGTGDLAVALRAGGAAHVEGIDFAPDPTWMDAAGISFTWRADQPGMAIHVALAVQDRDHSVQSRDLIAAFVNSTYFDLVATPAPGQDLEVLTVSNHADAAYALVELGKSDPARAEEVRPLIEFLDTTEKSFIR